MPSNAFERPRKDCLARSVLSSASVKSATHQSSRPLAANSGSGDGRLRAANSGWSATSVVVDRKVSWRTTSTASLVMTRSGSMQSAPCWHCSTVPSIVCSGQARRATVGDQDQPRVPEAGRRPLRQDRGCGSGEDDRGEGRQNRAHAPSEHARETGSTHTGASRAVFPDVPARWVFGPHHHEREHREHQHAEVGACHMPPRRGEKPIRDGGRRVSFRPVGRNDTTRPAQLEARVVVSAGVRPGRRARRSSRSAPLRRTCPERSRDVVLRNRALSRAGAERLWYRRGPSCRTKSTPCSSPSDSSSP